MNANIFFPVYLGCHIVKTFISKCMEVIYSLVLDICRKSIVTEQHGLHRACKFSRSCYMR